MYIMKRIIKQPKCTYITQYINNQYMFNYMSTYIIMIYKYH